MPVIANLDLIDGVQTTYNVANDAANVNPTRDLNMKGSVSDIKIDQIVPNAETKTVEEIKAEITDPKSEAYKRASVLEKVTQVPLPEIANKIATNKTFSADFNLSQIPQLADLNNNLIFKDGVKVNLDKSFDDNKVGNSINIDDIPDYLQSQKEGNTAFQQRVGKFIENYARPSDTGVQDILINKDGSDVVGKGARQLAGFNKKAWDDYTLSVVQEQKSAGNILTQEQISKQLGYGNVLYTYSDKKILGGRENGDILNDILGTGSVGGVADVARIKNYNGIESNEINTFSSNARTNEELFYNANKTMIKGYDIALEDFRQNLSNPNISEDEKGKINQQIVEYNSQKERLNKLLNSKVELFDKNNFEVDKNTQLSESGNGQTDIGYKFLRKDYLLGDLSNKAKIFTGDIGDFVNDRLGQDLVPKLLSTVDQIAFGLGNAINKAIYGDKVIPTSVFNYDDSVYRKASEKQDKATKDLEELYASPEKLSNFLTQLDKPPVIVVPNLKPEPNIAQNLADANKDVAIRVGEAYNSSPITANVGPLVGGIISGVIGGIASGASKSNLFIAPLWAFGANKTKEIKAQGTGNGILDTIVQGADILYSLPDNLLNSAKDDFGRAANFNPKLDAENYELGQTIQSTGLVGQALLVVPAAKGVGSVLGTIGKTTARTIAGQGVKQALKSAAISEFEFVAKKFGEEAIKRSIFRNITEKAVGYGAGGFVSGSSTGTIRSGATAQDNFAGFAGATAELVVQDVASNQLGRLINKIQVGSSGVLGNLFANVDDNVVQGVANKYGIPAYTQAARDLNKVAVIDNIYGTTWKTAAAVGLQSVGTVFAKSLEEGIGEVISNEASRYATAWANGKAVPEGGIIDPNWNKAYSFGILFGAAPAVVGLAARIPGVLESGDIKQLLDPELNQQRTEFLYKTAENVKDAVNLKKFDVYDGGTSKQITTSILDSIKSSRVPTNVPTNLSTNNTFVRTNTTTADYGVMEKELRESLNPLNSLPNTKTTVDISKKIIPTGAEGKENYFSSLVQATNSNNAVIYEVNVKGSYYIPSGEIQESDKKVSFIAYKGSDGVDKVARLDQFAQQAKEQIDRTAAAGYALNKYIEAIKDGEKIDVTDSKGQKAKKEKTIKYSVNGRVGYAVKVPDSNELKDVYKDVNTGDYFAKNTIQVLEENLTTRAEVVDKTNIAQAMYDFSLGLDDTPVDNSSLPAEFRALGENVSVKKLLQDALAKKDYDLATDILVDIYDTLKDTAKAATVVSAALSESISNTTENLDATFGSDVDAKQQYLAGGAIASLAEKYGVKIVSRESISELVDKMNKDLDSKGRNTVQGKTILAQLLEILNTPNDFDGVLENYNFYEYYKDGVPQQFDADSFNEKGELKDELKLDVRKLAFAAVDVLVDGLFNPKSLFYSSNNTSLKDFVKQTKQNPEFKERVRKAFTERVLGVPKNDGYTFADLNEKKPNNKKTYLTADQIYQVYNELKSSNAPQFALEIVRNEYLAKIKSIEKRQDKITQIENYNNFLLNLKERFRVANITLEEVGIPEVDPELIKSQNKDIQEKKKLVKQELKNLDDYLSAFVSEQNKSILAAISSLSDQIKSFGLLVSKISNIDETEDSFKEFETSYLEIRENLIKISFQNSLLKQAIENQTNISIKNRLNSIVQKNETRIAQEQAKLDNLANKYYNKLNKENNNIINLGTYVGDLLLLMPPSETVEESVKSAESVMQAVNVTEDELSNQDLKEVKKRVNKAKANTKATIKEEVDVVTEEDKTEVSDAVDNFDVGGMNTFVARKQKVDKSNQANNNQENEKSKTDKTTKEQASVQESGAVSKESNQGIGKDNQASAANAEAKQGNAQSNNTTSTTEPGQQSKGDRNAKQDNISKGAKLPEVDLNSLLPEGEFDTFLGLLENKDVKRYLNPNVLQADKDKIVNNPSVQKFLGLLQALQTKFDSFDDSNFKKYGDKIAEKGVLINLLTPATKISGKGQGNLSIEPKNRNVQNAETEVAQEKRPEDKFRNKTPEVLIAEFTALGIPKNRIDSYIGDKLEELKKEESSEELTKEEIAEKRIELEAKFFGKEISQEEIDLYLKEELEKLKTEKYLKTIAKLKDEILGAFLVTKINGGIYNKLKSYYSEDNIESEVMIARTSLMLVVEKYMNEVIDGNLKPQNNTKAKGGNSKSLYEIFKTKIGTALQDVENEAKKDKTNLENRLELKLDALHRKVKDYAEKNNLSITSLELFSKVFNALLTKYWKYHSEQRALDKKLKLEDRLATQDELDSLPPENGIDGINVIDLAFKDFRTATNDPSLVEYNGKTWAERIFEIGKKAKASDVALDENTQNNSVESPEQNMISNEEVVGKVLKKQAFDLEKYIEENKKKLENDGISIEEFRKSFAKYKSNLEADSLIKSDLNDVLSLVKAELKKILPADILVDFVDNLMTKEGVKALGVFYEGIKEIKLLKEGGKASLSVAGHEAFHVIFSLLRQSDPKLAEQILKQQEMKIRSKGYNTIDKIQGYLEGKHNQKLGYQSMLEEELAENFGQFWAGSKAIGFYPKIKSFFQALSKIIKKYLGIQDKFKEIQNLYDLIDSGAFNVERTSVALTSNTFKIPENRFENAKLEYYKNIEPAKYQEQFDIYNSNLKNQVIQAADLYGVKNLQIDNVAGFFGGEAEPSIKVSFDGDNSKFIAKLAKLGNSTLQDSIHISQDFEQLPKGVQPFVIQEDGSSFEQGFRFIFDKRLSQNEIAAINKFVTDNNSAEDSDYIAGFSIVDNREILVYDISNYSTPQSSYDFTRIDRLQENFTQALDTNSTLAGSYRSFELWKQIWVVGQRTRDSAATRSYDDIAYTNRGNIRSKTESEQGRLSFESLQVPEKQIDGESQGIYGQLLANQAPKGIVGEPNLLLAGILNKDLGKKFEPLSINNLEQFAINQDEVSKTYWDLPNKASKQEIDKVDKSYEALKTEIIQQFNLLQKYYNFEFDSNPPYTTTQEVLIDINANRNLIVFSEFSPDHLIEPLGDKSINVKYKDIPVNLAFRAVHDLIGHSLYANDFSSYGEEIAWMAHSQSLSKEAQLALTIETRGQAAVNSYTDVDSETKPSLAAFRNRNSKAFQTQEKGFEDFRSSLETVKTDLKKGQAQFDSYKKAQKEIIEKLDFAEQKYAVLPDNQTDWRLASRQYLAQQPKYSVSLTDQLNKEIKGFAKVFPLMKAVTSSEQQAALYLDKASVLFNTKKREAPGKIDDSQVHINLDKTIQLLSNPFEKFIKAPSRGLLDVTRSRIVKSVASFLSGVRYLGATTDFTIKQQKSTYLATFINANGDSLSGNDLTQYVDSRVSTDLPIDVAMSEASMKNRIKAMEGQKVLGVKAYSSVEVIKFSNKSKTYSFKLTHSPELINEVNKLKNNKPVFEAAKLTRQNGDMLSAMAVKNGIVKEPLKNYVPNGRGRATFDINVNKGTNVISKGKSELDNATTADDMTIDHRITSFEEDIFQTQTDIIASTNVAVNNLTDAVKTREIMEYFKTANIDGIEVVNSDSKALPTGDVYWKGTHYESGVKVDNILKINKEVKEALQVARILPFENETAQQIQELFKFKTPTNPLVQETLLNLQTVFGITKDTAYGATFAGVTPQAKNLLFGSLPRLVMETLVTDNLYKLVNFLFKKDLPLLNTAFTDVFNKHTTNIVNSNHFGTAQQTGFLTDFLKALNVDIIQDTNGGMIIKPNKISTNNGKLGLFLINVSAGASSLSKGVKSTVGAAAEQIVTGFTIASIKRLSMNELQRVIGKPIENWKQFEVEYQKLSESQKNELLSKVEAAFPIIPRGGSYAAGLPEWYKAYSPAITALGFLSGIFTVGAPVLFVMGFNLIALTKNVVAVKSLLSQSEKGQSEVKKDAKLLAVRDLLTSMMIQVGLVAALGVMTAALSGDDEKAKRRRDSVQSFAKNLFLPTITLNNEYVGIPLNEYDGSFFPPLLLNIIAETLKLKGENENVYLPKGASIFDSISNFPKAFSQKTSDSILNGNPLWWIAKFAQGTTDGKVKISDPQNPLNSFSPVSPETGLRISTIVDKAFGTDWKENFTINNAKIKDGKEVIDVQKSDFNYVLKSLGLITTPNVNNNNVDFIENQSQIKYDKAVNRQDSLDEKLAKNEITKAQYNVERAKADSTVQKFEPLVSDTSGTSTSKSSGSSSSGGGSSKGLGSVKIRKGGSLKLSKIKKSSGKISKGTKLKSIKIKKISSSKINSIIKPIVKLKKR